MKPPTCTDTSDGPCPSFPLNGTTKCTQHADPARVNGKDVDIGYRPGGLTGHDGVIAHPDPGDIRGIDAIPATRPARAYTAPEPAAPPTPTRSLARLWAFLTMARSRP